MEILIDAFLSSLIIVGVGGIIGGVAWTIAEILYYWIH